MLKLRYHFRLLGTVAALLVVGGSTVFALPAQATMKAQAATPAAAAAATTAANTSSAGNGNGAANGQSANQPAAAQTRLTDAKLKACQNRQTAITDILSRISDRGQKQLTLFSTIATRTEAFYTNQGKPLSNYAALVAEVNTQQTAAQAAVSLTSSSSPNFSCTGTDPKGFVNAFQGNLKTEISALQAYRTAVKNLIVGVKSVQTVTTSTGSNQ